MYIAIAIVALIGGVATAYIYGIRLALEAQGSTTGKVDDPRGCVFFGVGALLALFSALYLFARLVRAFL